MRSINAREKEFLTTIFSSAVSNSVPYCAADYSRIRMQEEEELMINRIAPPPKLKQPSHETNQQISLALEGTPPQQL